MYEFMTETFFVLTDVTLEKHVQREMLEQFPGLVNYEFCAWEEFGDGVVEFRGIDGGDISTFDLADMKAGELYITSTILEWLVANKVLPAGDYLIRV